SVSNGPAIDCRNARRGGSPATALQRARSTQCPAQFTRATRRCVVSQPTLSNAIQSLAHVPEKWEPVFRKGHAPINESRAHPDSTQSGCALEDELGRLL